MVLPLTATLSRLYVVVIFPLMSSLSSSSPSPPSFITLFFLFFYQIHLLPSARALTINTAELCRPDRTIHHAPATFGPRPDHSGIHNVKLFAPRPQENGVYLNIPSSALTSSPTIIKSANSKNLDHLIHQQQRHQAHSAMPAQGLMFHRNLLSLLFGNGHDHARKQKQQRINMHTVHLSSSTSSADSPHEHGVTTGTQSKQQQQQQYETKIGRSGGGGMFVQAAPMKQQRDIYTHSNSRHDHHSSNSKSIAASTSTMNIINRPSSVSSSPSLSTQLSSSTPTPTPLPTPQPQFLRSFISPWRAWTNRHRTTDQYQTLSQFATNSLAHSSSSYQTPPLAQPPNYIPIPVVDHHSSERQDLVLSSSESEHKHGPNNREPLETDTDVVRPSFESWRRSNKHISLSTGTSDSTTTIEQFTSSRIITAKSDSIIKPTRQDVTKNALEIPPLFDACIPLSVPADVETVKGRVAVVARGVCDFSEKVTLMQEAGAVGVIVVNSESDGNQLATMKRNDSKLAGPAITIPSVMISFQSWVKFAPCVNDTTVNFNSEGQYNNANGRDALNWAMMRGMALWILCQCGVNVVRYKRRVSEFRARADAIAALPVDTYSRSRNQQRRNRHSNNSTNSSSGGVGSSSNSGHNHSNNNNNSHEHSSSSSNSNIINNNINNVSNDNNENLNNNYNLNVNSNINHHNHNIMCDHTSSTTTTTSLPPPSSATDDEKWHSTTCGTAGGATTATGRTSTTPQSTALSSCTPTGLNDNVSSSSFSSMAGPSSIICDGVQQQDTTDIYQCQHSKPFGMRSSSVSATTRSRPLSMPVGVGYNLTTDEHINLIGPSASASASMSNTGESSLKGCEGNDGGSEVDDVTMPNAKNMDGNEEDVCLRDVDGHSDDDGEDVYDEDELANLRRGAGKRRRRGCGSSCDTPSVPLLATTTSKPSSSSSPPQSQLQTTTTAGSSSSSNESSSSSGRQMTLPQSGSSSGTASGSSNILDEDEIDTDEDDGLCAICLEEFEEGQEVRPLACRHLYHRSCIDPWLQSSSNCCPLCKREVPNLPPPPTQLHYGSMIV